MKSRGFSLIEVMVALIIISVGLLGIAKMQALALSSTGTARLRSLAAIQAASLASSMHADRSFWSTGALTVNITGTTIDNSTLAAARSCTDTGGGRPTPCTAAQMAAEDLQQWVASVKSMLPNDTAKIDCQQLAGTPVSCTVMISWSEHIVNSNTSEIVPTGTPTPTTYKLVVEP